MIVSRTPLRMSFVGGGSDLPSYYRQAGGAVLSTSVDKYMYITINKKFDNKYINIFNWSIKNPNYFWSSIWDYCKVKGIKSKKKINKSSIFYKNIFLPKSKLNFGENLKKNVIR